MADWDAGPDLDTDYRDVLTLLKARDTDAGTMASPVNPPDGWVRHSVDRLQRWSTALGTWVDLPLGDIGWIAWGDAPLFQNAGSFRVAGNRTSRYPAGARLRLAHGDGVTVYGTVTAAGYDGPGNFTLVTIQLDSGALDTDLTRVDVSVIDGQGLGLPRTLAGVMGRVALTAGGLLWSGEQRFLGSYDQPLVIGETRIWQRGDGKVYAKTGSAPASENDGVPFGAGSVTIAATPPAGADPGALWWNSDESSGALFVRYGATWVPAFSAAGLMAAGVSKAPAAARANLIIPDAAAAEGLVIRAGAGQTADLLAAEDESGNLRFAIGANGRLRTGGIVLLASAVASGTAALDFTLPTSGFDMVELQIERLLPSQDAVFRLYVSTDNGATWKTSGYICVVHWGNQGGLDGSTLITTYIGNSTTNTGAAYIGTHGRLWMYLSSLVRPVLSGVLSHAAADGTHGMAAVHGLWNNTVEPITSLRLTFSAGTVASGRARLLGYAL
jgi:hypothetical protein